MTRLARAQQMHAGHARRRPPRPTTRCTIQVGSGSGGRRRRDGRRPLQTDRGQDQRLRAACQVYAVGRELASSCCPARSTGRGEHDLGHRRSGAGATSASPQTPGRAATRSTRSTASAKTSASNIVTDAIAGVTLTLQGATAADAVSVVGRRARPGHRRRPGQGAGVRRPVQLDRRLHPRRS